MIPAAAWTRSSFDVVAIRSMAEAARATRRLHASAAAGRPPIRARALRPDAKKPAGIDAGERTAARPHSMDIEHGYPNGAAVDDGFGCLPGCAGERGRGSGSGLLR